MLTDTKSNRQKSTWLNSLWRKIVRSIEENDIIHIAGSDILLFVTVILENVCLSKDGFWAY